jgi:hypothetical protein
VANIERDKFLTEMMGECWHEQGKANYAGGMFLFWTCAKCKEGFKKSDINDFSAWEGFGKLWEFAIKQDWWQGFLNKQTTEIINPDRFSNAVYEFLKEKT